MIPVYYQSPSGLTLALALTAAPGDAPSSVDFEEDDDVPGLYVAAAPDDAEGQIAIVTLGGNPFDGGTIAEGDDGRLWVMPRTAATRTPVNPVSANAPSRINGTMLTAYLGEHGFDLEDIPCYGANREPQPLTGMTLRIVIRDKSNTLLYEGDDFTGSGSSFDFPIDSSCTNAVAIGGDAHYWALLKVGASPNQQDIQVGRLEVKMGARRTTT